MWLHYPKQCVLANGGACWSTDIGSPLEFSEKTKKLRQAPVCLQYLQNICTFSVAPFGPISLWRRFTNLSLLRTRLPILIISQATSSSNTRRAYSQYTNQTHIQPLFESSTLEWETCSYGTLRAISLIISRDLMIMYGSHVLRVVLTVILPSTKSNVQSIP